MSLHDYQCACGHLARDYNVPIDIGAKAGAPSCPRCGAFMSWIPQVGRMDAYEPFQEFTATDCYGKPVTVESMAQIRKIERESEREYAHGPRDSAGQPVAQKQVWRDYSQDRSNADVHTFARHLDRDMTMQERRLDAKSQGVGRLSEREAEKLAGKDVAFSAGDVLGEAGS